MAQYKVTNSGNVHVQYMHFATCQRKSCYFSSFLFVGGC